MLRFCILICILLTSIRGDTLERQLESYFPCKTDRDCIPNSFCSLNMQEKDGLCVCNPNYIIQRNHTYYTCLKKAEQYEDPCTDDIQCQEPFSILGICFAGKCVCEPGSHFYKHKCWKTEKLGQFCRSNENCLLKNNQLAFCHNGRCSCDIGFKPISDKSGEDCVHPRKIGDSCSLSDDCTTDHSVCSETICMCQIGYTSSDNMTQCLKEALYLNETCVESIQCEKIRHTECKNETCQCTQGFYGRKNICYQIAIAATKCDTLDDCGGDEIIAKCVDGVCKCLISADAKGHCISGTADLKQFVYYSIITVLILNILKHF